MDGINSVDIKVGNLPLERKFSYLSDGITRRQCIIADINLNNKIKLCLLEIEREKKSLSMLLIKTLNTKIYYHYFYEILLKDLVLSSGSWKSENLEQVMNLGCIIQKNKHIDTDNKIYAVRLYKKILSM